MPRQRDILLLDNNAVRQLAHGPSRERLKANLKATGREFWPTGINVLEAVKAHNAKRRIKRLETLHDLAGDAHAFPLPTEALLQIARAHVDRNSSVTWADPRLTAVLRDPATVTHEQIEAVRGYLEEQERQFDATGACQRR